MPSKVQTAAPILAACLAGAALLPGTAYARDGKAAELEERLNDPMTQYAVAGMLSAMAKAILEMPVEPFAKAMEGVGGDRVPRLPPDASVGDLAGTDTSMVREELIDKVPKAMGRMGAMAGAVEAMMPELEKMAKRMKDAVPRY